MFPFEPGIKAHIEAAGRVTETERVGRPRRSPLAARGRFQLAELIKHLDYIHLRHY